MLWFLIIVDYSKMVMKSRALFIYGKLQMMLAIKSQSEAISLLLMIELLNDIVVVCTECDVELIYAIPIFCWETFYCCHR